MENSLNQIADQIINAVYAGLKSPANYSLSKAQVKDEIAQARNRLIERQVANGVFEPEPFRQTIKKIQLTKEDFSDSGVTTTRKELRGTIPELLFSPGIKPIQYITAMDRGFQFKIIYGNDFFYYKRSFYADKKPTAWVQDRVLWLFNPPIANIQHVGMRAILENPRSVNEIPGNKFIDDDPYPMPLSMVDEIKLRLVNDYINQYRRGSMQPTLMAGDVNISTPTK